MEGALCGKTVCSLDEASVVQLCAGQVIVDVKSCVRELVDNALDACSREIQIRLVDEGVTLIEVSDDGHGIPRQELNVACARSSTSKISSFQDIHGGLPTLGFRGEALSALANVGKVAIVSRTSEDQWGTRMKFDHHGRPESGFDCVQENRAGFLSVSATRCFALLRVHVTQLLGDLNVGTTVIVEDIFWRLPVRRRELQRTGKAQVSALLQLLTAYALIQNHVRFIFITQSKRNPLPKTLLCTEGGSRKTLRESVQRLFGASLAEKLLDVDIAESATSSLWRLSGLILPPSQCHQKQRRLAFFYVNNKYIVSGVGKLIAGIHALYHTLSSGKPTLQYVFHLEMSSELVDVNVTPDKQTVFIRNLSDIIPVVLNDLERILQPYVLSVKKDVVSNASSSSATANEDPVKKESTVASNGSTLLDDGSRFPSKRQADAAVSLQLVNEETKEFKQSLKKPKIRVWEYPMQTEVFPSRTSAPASEMCDDQPSAAGEGVISFSEQKTSPSSTLRAWEYPLATTQQGSMSTSSSAARSSADSSDEALNEKNPTSAEVNKKTGQDHTIDEEPKKTLVNRRESKLADAVNRLELDAFGVASPDTMTATADDGTDSTGNNVSETNKEMSSGTKPSQLQDTFPSHLLTEKRKPWAVKRTEPSVMGVEGVQLGTLVSDEKRVSKETLDVDPLNLEAAGSFAANEAAVRFPKDSFLSIRVVGQFNRGFIIGVLPTIDKSDQKSYEVFIIDQHATDEKYKFESLCAAPISAQPLVAPLRLDLSPAEKQTVLNYLPVFRENGFQFLVSAEEEEFCPTSVPRTLPIALCFEKNESANASLSCLFLSALPQYGSQTLTADDALELVGLLREAGPVLECIPPDRMSYLRPSKVRAILASRACRSAVMIGDDLTKQQMVQIVRRMAVMQQPWNCPHGRPTMRHLLTLQTS